MDNFNNGNSGMPEDVTTMVDNIVNQDPAADLANKMENDLGVNTNDMPNSTPAVDLDGDEATNEQPAIPGEPPVKSSFNLVQDNSSPVAPQGAPMGGMGQPQYGQPMGNMNQPQYGQPMGNMNQQQFGQQMFGGNPYGQPMGGMNQSPMGGQPSKPKKVKKPLSKGAIAGIIGGGVALIALIVCAIIFIPKLFPSDKEVVVDAFEATFGIEAEAETEDTIGAAEIVDKFATTGGLREFYMEMSQDIDGENMSVYVKSVENIDVQNRLADASVVVGMDDSDILKVDMVVDDQLTYFQLPDMINGYFTLPSDNILQSLENSELGAMMELYGMPEYNMADIYFNLATSSSEGATEINSEYVAIVEKLWDSITYEKQGKAKIDVNGKTVNAKEYYVTLPEDSAKDAVGELWDLAVSEAASNPAYLNELGVDAATFEATLSGYSGLMKNLISGDLLIKVYIADGKIVKLSCADEVSIMGTPLEYDMFLDIDDENASGVFDITVMKETVGVKFEAKNINENPNGTITLYVPGETIDVNFNISEEASDSKESCDAYFDLEYNGTTYVSADVSVNMDKAANTMDGVVKLDIMDEGNMELAFTGGLKDVNKGVGYTIDISKCELLIDGESMLNMSGYVKLDTSQHTAAGVDSSLPVYDITTLTLTDYEEIILLDENVSLIESWMETLYGALGMDYSDYTYEEPDYEEPVYEEPEEGNMILEASAKSVEILGTIPGFDYNTSSDYYVYFETEEWSYIEYVVYEGWTPEEIVADIYVPSEGVITQEIGQTIDLEGETIYYSYVLDNEFGYNFSNYMFARDLGDGVVLVVSAGIYDDDDTYTIDQLVEAISSQYYQVIQ